MQIENLSKELDLTAVRGGDNSNSAVNAIGQQSKIAVPVGVLGGMGNTSVHVKGSQNSDVGTVQYAGDSLLALFPSFGFEA